jgi:hypothetical protein
MDNELTVPTLPVSDVDLAVAFHAGRVGLGLGLDYHPPSNVRVVQMTPPGSARSIQISLGRADALTCSTASPRSGRIPPVRGLPRLAWTAWPKTTAWPNTRATAATSPRRRVSG